MLTAAKEQAGGMGRLLRRVVPAVAIAVAGLFVCAGSNARADSPLALVTGDNYPPFADEKLAEGGTATALVRRVFDLMGRTTTVTFRPWRRGYEEMLHGRFDASFPYVRTTERERDVLYSLPIVTVRQEVFMAADRRFAFAGAADLKGRQICAALGYALPADLQQMLERGEIERTTPANSESCPGMLAAGRVDFFLQDKRIGTALIDRAGIPAGAIVVAPTPYATASLHLIVPRGHAQASRLIGDFNAALRRLQASPEYERLLALN